MRDHVRVLGILNIILGALIALVGLIAFVAMGSVAGIIAASLNSATGEDYHNGMIAAPIVATVGVAVGIFFLVLGLPAIIGGWGLMHYRPWSRVLMIVVSVLHLFHIPLGTALGVYGLWVLLSDEGRRVLESGGLIGAPGSYGPAAFPANYGPPPPSASV